MARYSQGFRLSATSAGTPLLELIGGAGSRARLVEFGLTPITQVVGSVGLGFAAAIGITPTTPVTFLSEQDNSTLAVTSAMAWGTAPTLPTYFYRRASVPLTQDEIVWTWPAGGGLVLLPATSLVLWNFATGPGFDAWAVFEQ